MVWEFKGQEGNSHGDGKAKFSNYMFAGPSLTAGRREDFNQTGPARFLPVTFGSC